MTEDNRITQIRAVLLDFGQYESGLNAVDVIEKIDEILGDEPPAPRVFFPGDVVPAGLPVQDGWGHVIDAMPAWRVSPDGDYKGGVVEVQLISAEQWDAAVDRARAARETP